MLASGRGFGRAPFSLPRAGPRRHIPLLPRLVHSGEQLVHRVDCLDPALRKPFPRSIDPCKPGIPRSPRDMPHRQRTRDNPIGELPVPSFESGKSIGERADPAGERGSAFFNEPFPTGLAGSTASFERTEALRRQPRSHRADQDRSGSRSTVVSIPRRKPRIWRIEGSVRVPSLRISSVSR